MKSAYLLTGLPGSGKTSLIKELASVLGDKAGGFYTEEIRKDGRRFGFDLVTLEEKRTPLAHREIKSPYCVSSYGINLEALETEGIAALQRAREKCRVIIVDEIGKMELFSPRFQEVILEIIQSNRKVLGTIMLKPDPRTARIKRLPQVEIIHLTRQNRAQVLGKILEWLQEGPSPHYGAGE